MISIAREILFHDKLRLFITVASLAFAIVMIVYNMGMFFGTVGESVSLIDHAAADLWVIEEGYSAISDPSEVPASAARWALRAPGVEQACRLSLSGGSLQVSGNHPVMIVVIEPDCAMIQPWDIRSGDASNLGRKDTIALDDYILRSDPASVGDQIELNGRKLQVAAITHNNKSFTTPFVFVSRETWLALGGLAENSTFIVARLSPGADPNAASTYLESQHPDLDVFSAEALRQGSMMALISAGLGAIFIVVAVGVLVGLLIITMTIYTATMEQLRDFAILKAIGATRRKIVGIVLEQSIGETALGFALGLACSLGLNLLIEQAVGLRGSFPVAAVLGAFGIMLSLAVLGSLISVRKAISVDPTVVFRS